MGEIKNIVKLNHMKKAPHKTEPADVTSATA